MRKLLSTIIILFLFYIGLQILFNLFGGGHSSTYSIKNENNTFEIREVFINSKDFKGYDLEVSKDDEVYNFQTMHNLFGASRVIKNILSFESDNYKCILPLFHNNLNLIDFICKKDNVQYLYQSIKGNDKDLDDFILKAKDLGYNEEQFYDDKLEVKIVETMTAYVNNIVKDHFVTINNYRGIFTINTVNLQRMNNVPLFNSDTYKRPISALVDKYYITADYNQRFAFDKFKIVDITTNKTFDLFINGKIEHTSYVQGVYENKMYLLDTYNKKQYEVRINPFVIVEIGNDKVGVKQLNFGEWSRISMADAIKNKPTFNLILEEKEEGFVKVSKIEKNKNQTYYLFKRVGNSYEVYKKHKSDGILTYLFETKNIDDIIYINDFIYFTNGKEVKYYNNYYGLRTLFSNTELEFNESLYYNVYKK